MGSLERSLEALAPQRNEEAAVAFEPEGHAGGPVSREVELSLAIESSRRGLVGEMVDFEFAFRRLSALGHQLAKGEVRLRSVVDVSSDGDGTTEQSGPAMKHALAGFERLARSREAYRRQLKAQGLSPRVALSRTELMHRIEALSIHPTQYRRIDDELERLLSALSGAEQSLRAAGVSSRVRVSSVRAWVKAARRLPPASVEASLSVLRGIEREAGEPLAEFRQHAIAFHCAHAQLEESKTEMFKANLGMVRSIASRYKNRGLDQTDLLQEGSIGLMRAVERFDHSRGFRFSTYAHWWVRQAITRAISDTARTVRVPVHIHEEQARLNRISAWLTPKLGRPPTVDELAETAGLSPEKVSSVLRHQQQAVSLDAPLRLDDDASLLDSLADPAATDASRAVEEAELRHRLEQGLAELPASEQEVLKLRFGMGVSSMHTLEEIGRFLGVSRERVRQIEAKGLKRLNQRARGLNLGAFLH